MEAHFWGTCNIKLPSACIAIGSAFPGSQFFRSPLPRSLYNRAQFDSLRLPIVLPGWKLRLGDLETTRRTICRRLPLHELRCLKTRMNVSRRSRGPVPLAKVLTLPI